MWFVFSLQLVKFHTLTSLSHPAETMMGLLLVGEKRTQEIHSECPSSWMVYLQTPSVFHSLIVRSREPETICLLSAEKATLRTSFVCPTNLRVVVPIVKSQRRRVLSQDPERANCPSDDMTTSETKWLWPVKHFF